MAITGAAISAHPASGQRVELLTFPDAPIGHGSEPEAAISEGVDDERLAHDFHLLGLGARQSSPQLVVGGTAIPAWMRTGLPLSSGSGAPTFASAMPCAALPYRPRRDLSLATEARRARLFPLVVQAACEAGLPVGLFDALIVQESRYSPGAVSPKGAIGLAQLMPGTARDLSVADPFDALANLRGGARYLREQLTAFGRVDLALAAYNAGPGRVRARWAVPRIRETQGYVSSVTRGWRISVAPETALFDFRDKTPPLPSPPAITGRAAKLVLFDGGG